MLAPSCWNCPLSWRIIPFPHVWLQSRSHPASPPSPVALPTRGCELALLMSSPLTGYMPGHHGEGDMWHLLCFCHICRTQPSTHCAQWLSGHENTSFPMAAIALPNWKNPLQTCHKRLCFFSAGVCFFYSKLRSPSFNCADCIVQASMIFNFHYLHQLGIHKAACKWHVKMHVMLRKCNCFLFLDTPLSRYSKTSFFNGELLFLQLMNK